MEQVAAGGGGGGVTLADYNTNTYTGLVFTYVTLTKPTGVANDDTLILIGSDSGNSAFTTPTGWTTILAANAKGCNINACYRIATGHATYEAATIQYGNGGTQDKVGSYLLITGASTTSPLDAVTASIASSIGTSHTIPAITTTATDTLAFYALGFDGGDGSPFSVSGTGWAEDEDVTTGGGVNDASMTWGTKEVAAIGTTGSATVASTGNDGAAYFQFNIKP